MNERKAALFIGSSSEGLEVARAIKHSLRDEAEVTLWDEGVFAPGQGTLEALVNALDRFDFSILVLTPDDLVQVRESKVLTARDNVLFELGLFMGRLGRSRTFVVCSDDPNLKLPSDLAGVTVLRFESTRSDANLVAAVGSASFQIRQAIRALGQSEARGLKRLDDASLQVESVGAQMLRLVKLLTRSRIVELDVIRNSPLGGLLPMILLRRSSKIFASSKKPPPPQTTAAPDRNRAGTKGPKGRLGSLLEAVQVQGGGVAILLAGVGPAGGGRVGLSDDRGPVRRRPIAAAKPMSLAGRRGSRPDLDGRGGGRTVLVHVDRVA
jgi:hypothetical protein